MKCIRNFVVTSYNHLSGKWPRGYNSHSGQVIPFKMNFYWIYSRTSSFLLSSMLLYIYAICSCYSSNR